VTPHFLLPVPPVFPTGSSWVLLSPCPGLLGEGIGCFDCVTSLPMLFSSSAVVAMWEEFFYPVAFFTIFDFQLFEWGLPKSQSPLLFFYPAIPIRSAIGTPRHSLFPDPLFPFYSCYRVGPVSFLQPTCFQGLHVVAVPRAPAAAD